MLLLVRASRPHVAFLGRIPGTSSYSDIARHPENEALPGVIAFRPEASLIYVNADAVLESVLNRLQAADPSDVRLVVCDLSASPYVDLAGSRMLHELHGELAARGITLRIVGAHGRCAICCEPTAWAKKSGASTGLCHSTIYSRT